MNSDPLFVSSDNHYLLADSPVIDAGSSEGAPDADIGDNARPYGDGVDMEAYEYCGEDCQERPPKDNENFRRGDIEGNNEMSLSDVIRFLNFHFMAIGTISCLDAADVDDNGILEITDAIRMLNFLFVGIGRIPDPPGPYLCGPDLNPDSFPPCDYPDCQ